LALMDLDGRVRSTGSERDVVVERHVVEIGRLGRGRVTALGRRTLLPVTAAAVATSAAAALEAAPAGRSATRAAAFPAAAEHLHVIGDDVGEIALLAIIAGQFAVGDASFDVDLRALLQVFAGDLPEL